MTNLESASFPLFHPTGVKVTFTVASDLSAVNAAITAALAAGYSVNAPGLQAGEERESVGSVVRFNQKNSDSTITPRIFFFPDNDKLVRKICAHYLNTTEDIQEFERVTGLTVSNLPVWSAKATPDKNDAKDAGVLITVKKPFNVVYILNPEYKGEGDKENTKYKFIRYEATAANPTPPSSSPANGTSTGAPDGGSRSEPLPTSTVGADGKVPFDQLFQPSEVTAATPKTLYPLVSGLFRAEQHFNNWWDEHKVELVKRTLEEAARYAKHDHWYWDKGEVTRFFEFGKSLLNLTQDQVMLALGNANGKPLKQVREWSGGNLDNAQAALWAYRAGYSMQTLSTYDLDDKTMALAQAHCQTYQQKESA